MKSLRTYILESQNPFLDIDTISELNEINSMPVEEIKHVFSVLNYKESSLEAQEILKNLTEKMIKILARYKYATTSAKYYTGIRALFNRIKLENYVIRKLNASNDISNVKQVSHEIDRKDNYDLTSSIGTIDVKAHFFGNKNFVFSKNEQKGVDWFCFVDMDLSDVINFNHAWERATLYLVNVKKMFNKAQTYAIGHSYLQDKGDHYLILMKDVKENAEYKF